MIARLWARVARFVVRVAPDDAHTMGEGLVGETELADIKVSVW